jgi:hypothetical protein
LEKDNVKENKTENDMEEAEVQSTSVENTEEAPNHVEEVINNTEEVINDTEEVTNDTEEVAVTVTEEIEELNSEEANENPSVSGVILANILDQLLVVALTSLLVFLCNSILRLFGYMFVQGNGSIILAGGIIYYIMNCIYAPIMEKTKLRTTIARKILNI